LTQKIRSELRSTAAAGDSRGSRAGRDGERATASESCAPVWFRQLLVRCTRWRIWSASGWLFRRSGDGTKRGLGIESARTRRNGAEGVRILSARKNKCFRLAVPSTIRRPITGDWRGSICRRSRRDWDATRPHSDRSNSGRDYARAIVSRMLADTRTGQLRLRLILSSKARIRPDNHSPLIPAIFREGSLCPIRTADDESG